MSKGKSDTPRVIGYASDPNLIEAWKNVKKVLSSPRINTKAYILAAKALHNAGSAFHEKKGLSPYAAEDAFTVCVELDAKSSLGLDSRKYNTLFQIAQGFLRLDGQLAGHERLSAWWRDTETRVETNNFSYIFMGVIVPYSEKHDPGMADAQRSQEPDHAVALRYVEEVHNKIRSEDFFIDKMYQLERDICKYIQDNPTVVVISDAQVSIKQILKRIQSSLKDRDTNPCDRFKDVASAIAYQSNPIKVEGLSKITHDFLTDPDVIEAMQPPPKGVPRSQFQRSSRLDSDIEAQSALTLNHTLDILRDKNPNFVQKVIDFLKSIYTTYFAKQEKLDEMKSVQFRDPFK